MVSFNQRSDTQVIDEPFYARYLTDFPHIEHPGKEDVLSFQPETAAAVIADMGQAAEKTPHLFVKDMGHHLKGVDPSFMFQPHYRNIYLIRDPQELISSFAKVIETPTIDYIGTDNQVALFNKEREETGRTPIVLDSNSVLSNPKEGLKKLCVKLELPFEEAMLSWGQNDPSLDVPWAPYWYKNVMATTGFAPQRKQKRPLPAHLTELYEEVKGYYDQLKPFAI